MLKILPQIYIQHQYGRIWQKYWQQHSCIKRTTNCCAMFPNHSVSLLVDWVIQRTHLAVPRNISYTGSYSSALIQKKISFSTWLPNPQVDRSTMLLNSIAKLLNSPNYSTLYTQNTKQNQNEKKVSTYKNLIFWPSAFICLHPLCHHVVDKMLW